MNPSQQVLPLPPPCWDGPWRLRLVNDVTMRAWLGRFHYLGESTPSTGVRPVGVYAPDMIALVVFAAPANVFGVAAKYGLDDVPGNVEVARVAVHPASKRNTASRSIAAACRWLHGHDGSEWVFSYADTGQNHHGGIYQALNAVYVGVSEPRPGYLVDGAPMHPRSVVSWLGTQGRRAAELAALRGRTLVQVRDMVTPKHTYIVPVGGPASRRQVRARLRPFARPYPKRDDGLPSTVERVA